MSRHRHHWYDDRLGSILRSGLADTRRAEPSPAVWRRIEAEIGPARRRWRPLLILGRLVGEGRVVERSEPTLYPLLALRGATVLSLALAVVLMVGGFETSPTVHTEPRAAYGPLGLSVAEMAIQPELDRRMTTLALSPGPPVRRAAPEPERYRHWPSVPPGDTPSLGSVSE